MEVATTVVAGLAVQAAFPLLSSLLGGGAEPKAAGPRLQELEPVRVQEGAKMWRFCGSRARVPGTIIYCSKIKESKSSQSVGSGKSGGSVQTWKYTVTIGIAWGQAFAGTNGYGKVSKLVRIIANGKTVWSAKKPKKGKHRYDSMNTSLGGRDVGPSAVMEEIKGSGKVSGERDTCWTLFKGLNLKDWGGAIPQDWGCILEPDPTPYSAGDALKDVFLSAPNRSADEIDVTGATGKNTLTQEAGPTWRFKGLQVEGPEVPLKSLDAMMMALDLSVQDRGGVVTIFDRGTETVVAVDPSHLGCAASTSEPEGKPVRVRDKTSLSLPSMVEIGFRDIETAYKRASVRQRVDNAPVGENDVEIDLPMVFDREEAMRIARRRAFEPYRIRKEMMLDLPPDYVEVLEGDVLAVPWEGQTYYVRVDRRSVGANWLIHFEGTVIDERAGADEVKSQLAGNGLSDLSDVVGDLDGGELEDPEDDTDDEYAPLVLATYYMNMPACGDEECDDHGFWLAHAGENIAAAFAGTQLYRAGKAGGPYKKVKSASFDDETPLMGYALNALPDSPAVAGYWDRENYLDVQLFEGQLESLSRDDVESGEGWLAVGPGGQNKHEIIAFRNAELQTSVDVALSAAAELQAPDVLHDPNVDFVSAGVQIGAYVRLSGFLEDDNLELARKVIDVSIHDVQLDTTAGDVVDEVQAGGGRLKQGDVYRLTTLLRGLRNTEEHAADHAIGDEVVGFQIPELSFVPWEGAKLNKAHYLKDVPEGLALGDVSYRAFSCVAETTRPFSPVMIRGVRSGGTDNKNLTMKWGHRTRTPWTTPTDEDLHDLRPNEPWAKADGDERYVVEIYSDEAMTDLLRKKTVNAGREHDDNEFVQATYPVTEQVADGLTAGAEVWVKIYQLAKTGAKPGNPSFKHFKAFP